MEVFAVDKPKVYVTWDQEDEVFPAVLTRYGDGQIATWNGWVAPEFDRPTAERLVAVNDSIVRDHGRESADAFRWYGDVLVERWSGHETEVEWPESLPDGEDSRLEEPFEVVGRTSDGRYPIGAFAWTWSVVETEPHDFLSRDDAVARPRDGVKEDACVFCDKAERRPIHACA